MTPAEQIAEQVAKLPPLMQKGLVEQQHAAGNALRDVKTGRGVAIDPADPVNKFVASMTMTFDRWHDGEGYDLAALDRMPPDRVKEIETVLLDHRPVDWRDVQALARIDSSEAKAAVTAALEDPDAKVRKEALRHVPGEQVDPKDREKNLLTALENDDLFGGLSQAIDEAAEFHPPAVVALLIKGTLDRNGHTAVLFAGLLYFIHGRSDSAFDWNYRLFFLRFDTSDRKQREAVFHDLCQTIGVNPAKYRT